MLRDYYAADTGDSRPADERPWKMWQRVLLVVAAIAALFALGAMIAAIFAATNKPGNKCCGAEKPLRCKPRTQPPSGLKGRLLLETSFFETHVAAGRSTFQSGRTCYHVATVNGYVYRVCDDTNTPELWLDLTAFVASVGNAEEGLVGFAVSPDGSRAYTHMITWVSPDWVDPGFDLPSTILCNRTYFFPPTDEWMTLPAMGVYNVTEWTLSGAGDTPSNPFTLLRYSVYSLSHAGVDSLRMLNNNELLIAIGDSSSAIDYGRYSAPNQIFGNTWLMDLRRRRSDVAMVTAPRAIDQLPQLVRDSLTLVFSRLRNGAAPTFDTDVYPSGDPLFLQWMMGSDSGESMYAFRGADAQRFSGWPCYLGLGWNTANVPVACAQSTVSSGDDDIIGASHDTSAAAVCQSPMATRVPIDVSTTFIPSGLSFNVYANLFRYFEARYLPFGFGPGRASATCGPSNNATGFASGFIGSALIRVNEDECPIAFTGAFQTLWTFDNGVGTSRDPIATANNGFSLGIPHLSAWLPDYTHPEQQVPTYDYSSNMFFAGSYGGPGRIVMTALSSTNDHREMLLSHFRLPDSGSGMSFSAQTWIVEATD